MIYFIHIIHIHDLSREHANPQLTCSQRQWLHSSVGLSIAPVSRGHGFKLNPVEVQEFFSGFSSQLHKLRLQLRGSSFT